MVSLSSSAPEFRWNKIVQQLCIHFRQAILTVFKLHVSNTVPNWFCHKRVTFWILWSRCLLRTISGQTSYGTWDFPQSRNWRAWWQSVWLARVDKIDTLAVALGDPPSWNSQASSSHSDPSWHSTLRGRRAETLQSDLNWISDGQIGFSNSGVV